MRIFFNAFLVFLLVSSIALAEEQGMGMVNVSSFEDYASILIDRHPHLKGLDSALEAARQRPDQAYALADPNLSVGIVNAPYDPFSFKTEGMTQKRIGLSQSFPAIGKRSLKEQVAKDDIVITEMMIPEKRFDLLLEAWIGFLKLEYLGKVRLSVLKNREILDSFIKIASAKYSVGTGIQQNVLHAQVELSKMDALLIEVDESIGVERTRLLSMAGMPMDTDISMVKAPAVSPSSGEADELLEHAVSTRPLFKAKMLEVEKSGRKVEIAKRELWPNYKVDLAYGQRESSGSVARRDLFSANFTFSVPLWQKSVHDKKVVENRYLQDKATDDYNLERLKLRKKIARLVEIRDKKIKLLALYNEGLLLQASQTVEAAMAAYQVNKIDFLTLVTNQISLFNYEIERDKVYFELHSTQLRLNREAGINMEEAYQNAK